MFLRYANQPLSFSLGACFTPNALIFVQLLKYNEFLLLDAKSEFVLMDTLKNTEASLSTFSLDYIKSMPGYKSCLRGQLSTAFRKLFCFPYMGI